MRFNRGFILAVLAFLLLVFVMEYRMPRKFVWRPTFGHTDRQPFGCYVFDSVLSASLPQGYRVTRKTFFQLCEEPRPQAYLAIASEMKDLTKTDIEALFRLTEGGSRVLLATGQLAGRLEDTLQVWLRDNSMLQQPLGQYATAKLRRDSIWWCADSVYQECWYYFYPQVCGSQIVYEKDAADCRALSMHGGTSEQDSIQYLSAAVFPSGKGAVILVATPLVLTNYGILDGRNSEYIFRLLSQLGGLPVVRTEAYGEAAPAAGQSPLRYVLSQRPLRWAFYLSLLTVLLFMGFTARRRQRPVPVAEPPRNRSLEFVKLIGTIYYQKKGYRELRQKVDQMKQSVEEGGFK